MVEAFSSIPIFTLGAVASLIAGLATVVGALPAMFIREISQKIQDILMGFGAGVMLAATSFSLIIPALDYAGNDVSAGITVVLGIFIGGIFLWLSDKYSPHEHFIKGPEGANP